MSVLGGALWPLVPVLWKLGGAARHDVRKHVPVLTLPLKEAGFQKDH